MRAVAPLLAPYVSSLVAYESVRVGPGVHIGLPSTALTLVLPVETPLEVAWADDDGPPSRFGAYVAGLHTRAAAIHHDGRMSGVQVGLTVDGARALLGVPAAALAGEVVDATEAAPWLKALLEQLPTAPRAEWAGRVENALLDAQARTGSVRRGGSTDRAVVSQALALLAGGRGVVGTAADVGYSRRHLADLVRREVGLAPQEYGRLARFERAVGLARARRGWAEVAFGAGYADQPHLSREWTTLTGCSPTAWARRELPFVQDVGTPASAPCNV